MLEVSKREQVVVTPGSPGQMVVVDRPQRVVAYVGGSRGPKGGIWSSYDEIPDESTFLTACASAGIEQTPP